MGRDWARVDGIDLLRGLSIVFVLMNHVNMRLLEAQVPYLVGLPGVCLMTAAASQSEWKAPPVLTPLLALGQRSYEIYLTHMFVVLGLFALFVRLGKPLRGVPLFFVAVMVCAGVVGWLVAVWFAEPMNRWIRRIGRLEERRVGVALPEVD